jgi:hypothetical protein
MEENKTPEPNLWPGLKGTTFESNIELIDREIAKRRKSWTLSSVPSWSYEDVAQLIRIHIFQKWDLYNPTLSLVSWLNILIKNQLKNIIRNLYGNYTRPCLKCAASETDSLCRIYTIQSNKCPLYGAWEKNRRQACAIKIPLPLENHCDEGEHGLYENPQDIEAAALKIHAYMQKILRPAEWKIYKALFVDGLSEEEAAKLINYRTTEKGRFAGYRQLKKIRKVIMAKVNLAINNDKIDV